MVTLANGDSASISQGVSDVVFLVEATANLAAYIEDIKTSYILPTLQYFSGGPPDPTDYGLDYNCTLYDLVLFHSADIAPSPAVQCSMPTTSTHQIVSWLDKIKFTGGRGESHSHITEALSTSLQVFEDITKLRGTRLQSNPSRHCLLICNSPPYQLPVNESRTYNGLSCEQLISLMASRGIQLSIFSPRKIAPLLLLYEEFQKALDTPPPPCIKEYTTSPRHMVLLSGFALEERSHTQKLEEEDQTNERLLSLLVESTSTTSTQSSTQFKIPTGAPSQPSSQQNTALSSQTVMTQATNSPIQTTSTIPQTTLQPNTISSLTTRPQTSNAPMLQTQAELQKNLQNSNMSGQRPIFIQQNVQTRPPIKLTQVANTSMSTTLPNTLQPSLSGSLQSGTMQGMSQSVLSQQMPGQQMPGQQMSGQQMPGQQMPGQAMPGQQMTSQQMSGQQMPGQQMTGQQMTGQLMTGQQMPGQAMPGQMPGQQMAGQQMPGQVMPGQQMPGGQTLPGVNTISGSGLSGANLQNSVLSSAAIRPRQPVSLGTQQNLNPAMNAIMRPNAPIGDLPRMPTGPGVQQRTIIWSGILEWQEKTKTTDAAKISRSLACQVSIGSTETDLNASKWPQKLVMQLVPQTLINPLHSLFAQSRSVLFQFTNSDESYRNLYRVMSSGFAGCVHFPQSAQCDVSVLMLLYHNRKKMFMGIIPRDQNAFIQGIRRVITKHKKMAGNGVPGPGTGVPSPQSLPSGTATPQNAPLSSQLSQAAVALAALPGTGSSSAAAAGGSSGLSEAERQANLQKIRALYQDLELATQKERQFQQQQQFVPGPHGPIPIGQPRQPLQQPQQPAAQQQSRMPMNVPQGATTQQQLRHLLLNQQQQQMQQMMHQRMPGNQTPGNQMPGNQGQMMQQQSQPNQSGFIDDFHMNDFS